MRPFHALTLPLSGDETLGIAKSYATMLVGRARDLIPSGDRYVHDLDRLIDPTRRLRYAAFQIWAQGWRVMLGGTEEPMWLGVGFDAASIPASNSSPPPLTLTHPSISPPFAPPRSRRCQCRIGYLSADFGDHPVGRLVASLPQFHDDTAFEVFFFALTPSDGSHWRTGLEARAVSLLGSN